MPSEPPSRARLELSFCLTFSHRRVYLPDFFNGEDLATQAPTPELREKIDVGAFVAKYHPREKAWPKVDAVLKEIKAKHPNAKVGAVGYCEYNGFPHFGSSFDAIPTLIRLGRTIMPAPRLEQHAQGRTSGRHCLCARLARRRQGL